MNPRQIVARAVSVSVVVGVLLGATHLAQAKEDDGAELRARAIEGVWLPIVTITDCQTHAVQATFPSMDLYARGGGLVAFGVVKQADQIGLGAWRYVGGRRYISEYQFFNYAPDGTPDGTLLRVSAAIQLNVAGTKFTSSEKGDIVDAAGHVLASICGARTATRQQ